SPDRSAADRSGGRRCTRPYRTQLRAPSAPATPGGTPRRHRTELSGNPSWPHYGSGGRLSGALHEGAADDAVGLQGLDLGLRKTQCGEKLAIVFTEQRCMPAVDPIGPPRETHRECAVARGSDHRMMELFEEATRRQLGHVGLVVGLHHLADG